jgi:hypothetical protein
MAGAEANAAATAAAINRVVVLFMRKFLPLKELPADQLCPLIGLPMGGGPAKVEPKRNRNDPVKTGLFRTDPFVCALRPPLSPAGVECQDQGFEVWPGSGGQPGGSVVRVELADRK